MVQGVLSSLDTAADGFPDDFQCGGVAKISGGIFLVVVSF
jgi:hypothetical protein